YGVCDVRKPCPLGISAERFDFRPIDVLFKRIEGAAFPCRHTIRCSLTVAGFPVAGVRSKCSSREPARCLLLSPGPVPSLCTRPSWRLAALFRRGLRPLGKSG